MKKTFLTLSTLLVGSFNVVSIAGEWEDKTLTEKKVKEIEQIIEDQGIYIETSQKGIKLSGYVDVSYSYNTHGGGTDGISPGLDNENRKYLSLQTPGNGVGPTPTHVSDADSQDFSVNQVKLVLEKELPDENKLAAGFRIDLMMGEDAKALADSGGEIGLGDGAPLVVQQAYVQFRVPVGNGLDFNFGKMVALLGYEVDENPANINFSRGLLYTYGMPGNMVGIYASYPFNDMFELIVGFGNGNNNGDSEFIDGSDFSKAVTVQIKWTAPGGNAWIAPGLWYSPQGSASAIGTPVRVDGGEVLAENEDIIIYNLMGEWRPKFAKDRLLLAFDAVYGVAEDNYRTYFADHQDIDIGEQENNAFYWGVALFGKYQFNKWFSLAGRVEYFHDEDGTAKFADGYSIKGNNISKDYRNPGTIYVTGTDLWSYTLTAGFDIWENMVARLEYRLDQSSAASESYVDGNNVETATFGDEELSHTFSLNMSYSF